jgi:VWFA-related protein
MRVRLDAKAALIAITISALSLVVSAQEQKPSTTTPVFKSKTELVLIPVSVRDKSGKAVTGLKQDAFTVKQDGKEQKIAVFEEIATGTNRITRPQLPPGVFTNTVADAQQRRLIIVALDTINTPFTDQTYARNQLIKFLSEQVQPDSLLCLVTIDRGGVKLIHDFTAEPKLLMAALRKVRGKGSVTEASDADNAALDEMMNDPIVQSEAAALSSFASAETQILQNDWRIRVLLILDSMNELAQAFAGVPGRKTLLWATGSFPFMFTDPNQAQNGPQFAEILPQYERTWQLLNNANIAVYPVDVRGLVNPGITAATRITASNARNFFNTAMQNHQQTIATMQMVADITGGRAFYNTNDLAKSFHRATEDSESYYLLGYYRDSGDTKPGWRKLKVDLRAEHVEVRARSGFYVAKPGKNPEQDRKTEMKLALVSPLEYTGVPMALEWGPASPDKKAPEKKKVPFAVVLPANAMEIAAEDSNHMSIEVVGVITDHEGKQITSLGQTIESHLKPEGLKQVTTSGITYQNAFVVPPGDYTARLVVRDAISGRIGTIISPLKVQ